MVPSGMLIGRLGRELCCPSSLFMATLRVLKAQIVGSLTTVVALRL